MIRDFWITLLFIPCALSFSQPYNAVLITEVMADPSPVNGLPDIEYVEIYNRSKKVISLKGWKLSSGSKSANLPDSLLLPGAYAIICQKGNTVAMSIYGRVIGVNSFLLTNSGMLLALYNGENQLICSVLYMDGWWASDKKGGGFSVEMIDLNNPCGEEDNWLTSVDKSGGTPGRKNSVEGSNTDITPPFVERINIRDNGELIIVFNERIDSLNAVSGTVIELSGHEIIKRELELPSFRDLKLIPDSPLLADQVYKLHIRNVADCVGNLLRESDHTVALPVQADSGDIIINEILFNPRDNGVDFVELYNRSVKYINLKNWALGNVKNDSLNVSVDISPDGIIMPPNTYLAITSESTVVKMQYPTAKSRNFLEVVPFPAYPNSEGGVILENSKREEFDKFIYNEEMHHELLSDLNGVSLEKIDAGKSSKETANWHSAAATVGYATPGYSNSQVKSAIPENDFIIEPEAFTPDNDGHEDYAEVKYKQSLTGQIATIRIFNASGRLIRNLIRNQLIGTDGSVRWDGTDEQGQLVNTGYYFFLIDTFDTAGNVHQFKTKVVVANKNR